MPKKIVGFVRVDEYRGHAITLNKSTGKYAVDSIVASGLDSIGAAHNAITKFLKQGQENVRQSVIVYRNRYSDEKALLIGTLTSFSISRRYRSNVQAVVVFAPRDRETMDIEHVYLNTPENQTLMLRHNELILQLEKIETELEEIRDKKMKTVPLPKSIKEKVGNDG